MTATSEMVRDISVATKWFLRDEALVVETDQLRFRCNGSVVRIVVPLSFFKMKRRISFGRRCIAGA